MSKCCCNNDVKFFKKPNAGICDACHPAENTMSPIETVAMCPPIGEPKLLTMMAPVVFDESGINLCRTICLDELEDACQEPTRRCTDILFDGLSKRDLANADKLQLQVVDINFNFVNPCDCRFSEIKPTKGNPNLSRITLKDIDVTIAVSVINCCCQVVKQGMLTIRYLGDERCEGFDPVTNPCAITFDLYTPYGVSYAPENPTGCNRLVPIINYMGFVGSESGICDCEQDVCTLLKYKVNNTIQQGITAQALAKVVASDEDCFAIGLTLFVKSIYFVQYRFQHEGVSVPPKLSPVAETSNNSCLDFVCGDLLETTIQPLEVGRESKTIRDDCCCDDRKNCCDDRKNCCDCSTVNGCTCAKCACNRSAATS